MPESSKERGNNPPPFPTTAHHNTQDTPKGLRIVLSSGACNLHCTCVGPSVPICKRCYNIELPHRNSPCIMRTESFNISLGKFSVSTPVDLHQIKTIRPMKTNITCPLLTTHEMLKALQNKFGSHFVEELYEDFVSTDAVESFGFFTDSLTAAYRSLRDPMFRTLVEGQYFTNL